MVHITDIYTEHELRTSPTYNEFLRRYDAADGLSVSMDGPAGIQVLLALANPTITGGWIS